MQRETKTLTTPAGKELVVKTYFTAGERNQVRAILMRDTKIDAKTMEPVDPNYSGALVLEAVNKQVEISVVSYAGVAGEGAYKAIMDAPGGEFDFIVAEAKKAMEGNFTSAK